MQASPSRFKQAMSSGYSRFTFVLVATLAGIHALDLSASPDQFDSAQTTIKFFTGGLPADSASHPHVVMASPTAGLVGASPATFRHEHIICRLMSCIRGPTGTSWKFGGQIYRCRRIPNVEGGCDWRCCHALISAGRGQLLPTPKQSSC